MNNKFPKKSKVFYINAALLLVAVVLVVNMVSPRGHELIRRAVAAVTGITGEGTLNKLVRFAGAQNPSNFIGDSIIYDNGTNVGIGTTTPGAKLTIISPDTTTSPGFSLRQSNANAYGYDFDTENNSYGRLDLYGVTNSVRTQLVTFMRSGNVGIGTTTPGYKLEVLGQGAFINNSNAALYFGENTTFIGRAGGANYHITGSALGDLAIRSTSGKKLLLGNDTTLGIAISAGNVGIGTVSPGAKLDVMGNIQIGNPAGTYSAYADVVYSPGNLHLAAATAVYINAAAAKPINMNGNVAVTGTVTATQFVGGGAGITGISATTATNLASGGNFAGSVACVAGSCPTNSAIRMTPNFHFNTPVGYAMIVNWDNGSTGGTVQEFRVGNGSGADAFYVRADGGVYGGTFNGAGTGLTGTAAGLNIGGSATYATTAGSAYPYRVGGVTMQMNWSGQGGQPSWLWGGNDGTNFYVYNPSNFSVSYAATAGSAPANGGTASNSSLLYDAYRGGYHYSSDLYVSYAYNAGYANTAGSAPANGGSATYATSAGYAGYVTGGWSGSIHQGVMSISGTYYTCMVYSNGTLTAINSSC